jgi:hypothetical protein
LEIGGRNTRSKIAGSILIKEKLVSAREHLSEPDGIVAIFVLEIEGRPTLAFEARDPTEALQIGSDAGLRMDLMEFTSNGVSICAPESMLNIRRAMQTEIQVFKNAIEVAPKCDQPTIAFLIGIDGLMVVTVGPEST